MIHNFLLPTMTYSANTSNILNKNILFFSPKLHNLGIHSTADEQWKLESYIVKNWSLARNLSLKMPFILISVSKLSQKM